MRSHRLVILSTDSVGKTARRLDALLQKAGMVGRTGLTDSPGNRLELIKMVLGYMGRQCQAEEDWGLGEPISVSVTVSPNQPVRMGGRSYSVASSRDGYQSVAFGVRRVHIKLSLDVG